MFKSETDKQKITILVVDDDDTGRYTISRILYQAGFEVIEAGNGAEGLKLAKEDPGLIILDVNLPDMSGFEVCRLVKANPATSLIPILHLSAAHRDSQSRVRGLEGGADGYLTQPVETPILLATVKSLLRMRQAEAEVVAVGRQWQITFDAINDGVCLMDTEKRIRQCNKAMANCLNKPMAEIIGHTCCEFVHGTSEVIERCPFLRMRETHARETLIFPLADRWFSIAADPMLDEDGNLIGAVHIMSDITEYKRAEEALRKLSITDNLTNLYNSRHFYNQLHAEIERAVRYNHPLSLLLLDVDNFKNYNDTYGHLKGDKVLAKMGEIIVMCLRKTDSAYRYGGEEFTVILPETDGRGALKVAERIRGGFETQGFSPAFDQAVYLTVSIGVAQYQPEEEFSSFIQRADMAMYLAKRKGKNQVIFSDIQAEEDTPND